MTDKEIIKALECCKRVFSIRNCLDCPYNKENSANCVSFMIGDALDLINRQQAEIERLKEWVDFGKEVEAYWKERYIQVKRNGG